MFFNSISYAVDIQARSVIVWLTWIFDSINGFVDVNREIQMSFITNLHEAHHMEFEDLNDHHTLQECKLYTQLTHRIYINEKNTGTKQKWVNQLWYFKEKADRISIKQLEKPAGLQKLTPSRTSSKCNAGYLLVDFVWCIACKMNYTWLRQSSSVHLSPIT